MGTLQAKLVILSLTAVTLLGGCAGEVPSPIVDALENYLDLLCVVELDLRYDVERANADFEFWYAVGTTGSMDALTLFKVEQLLFSSINENDLWCTQIYNTTEDVVTGNRDLQAVQRLGIVTFTPGSKDAPTEFDCPQSSNELMANTRADDCVVVRGEMRILAHPVDGINAAVSGIRVGLQAAMSVGNFGQNGEIAGVAFLSYLGNSEEEAINAHAVGAHIGDLSNAGDSGSGNFNSLEQGNSDDDEDNPLWLILVLGISAFTALFALAAFLVKKRRAEASKQVDKKVQDPLSCVVVGTGDPPDSFHDGLYHYMRNGRRYLSTQCEQCLQTKRSCIYALDDSTTFLTEKMGTIPEYETYALSHDDMLITRADSSLGLSQQHMGINVHKCNSATCKRCAPDSPQPIFLPTGVVGREEIRSGSNSTSSGTQSSDSSFQSSRFQSSLFTDMCSHQGTRS